MSLETGVFLEVDPEIRRKTWFLHKRGVFAFNSSDGNLWPIIDDYLIKSGVDDMMEIQTTAGMDLRFLKERFGAFICFQGEWTAPSLSPMAQRLKWREKPSTP